MASLLLLVKLVSFFTLLINQIKRSLPYFRRFTMVLQFTMIYNTSRKNKKPINATLAPLGPTVGRAIVR